MRIIRWCLCFCCFYLALGNNKEIFGIPLASYLPRTQNIIITLLNARFNTFVELLERAGLDSTLMENGPYTIFAPTNQAFADLDPGIMSNIQKDNNLLKTLLKYHIVNGEGNLKDIFNDLQVQTLEGRPVRFNIYSKEDSKVTTINGAKIIQSDLGAPNGIVHSIDRVLVPLEGDIVDALFTDSRFTYLVEALQKTGILETLRDHGPFTLFAPTNEAFNRLPRNALNDQPTVKTTLTRHIVVSGEHTKSGTFYAAGLFWNHLDAASGDMLRTGTYHSGRIIVASLFGRANIVQADIPATNGVIHVIDNII